MALLTAQQRMGAASLILAASTILSRLMGLARDKIISWQFGAGGESDMYFAAFVVPDIINYMLAGGFMSITIIPLLSRRFQEDEDDAWKFFSCVFCWMGTASLALTLAGMLAADVVVAVSRLTRKTVVERYGIPPEKVMVVHNAVARHEAQRHYPIPPRIRHEKRVLFLGRVTFQKGPEYFMEAARLVLQKIPNVRFFMAGSGDMLPELIRRAGQLRIGNRFHFAGFLRGQDVDRMFALSDLYVMPSVSEPFGITPLEAMLYDVPVLLSNVLVTRLASELLA